MKNRLVIWFIATLFIIAHVEGREKAVIIDHRHTNLAEIPTQYLDIIKSSPHIFHYVTRSHGWQIPEGLGIIETELGHRSIWSYPEMPSLSENAIKMYIGMPETDYVEPEGYFRSNAGMNSVRQLITAHPDIKYSMFAWCQDLHTWPDDPIVAEYLDSLNTLEQEFPDVNFIYMTSNAESVDPWGIWMKNENFERIRKFCRDNNKILFDFADLDCWKDGEQYLEHAYFEENGEVSLDTMIAVQHPDYREDGPGHTTAENCYNKGKAFWWMMAVLNGWEPNSTSVSGRTPELATFKLHGMYPNPFNARMTLEFSIYETQPVTVQIYDLQGRIVAILANRTFSPGLQKLIWHAKGIASGVYFVKFQTPEIIRIQKCSLIQ